MLVYIIGFMASGKTKIGKELAKQLEFDFIDLDKKIESIHTKSIADLFSTLGENSFRILEQNALHQTTHLKRTIVSCGGGTPCFYNNIDIMNYFGESVYLQTSEKLLTERLIIKKAKRPLVADKNEDEISLFVNECITNRKPFYEKAKHTISNTGMKEKSVAEIIDMLNA